MQMSEFTAPLLAMERAKKWLHLAFLNTSVCSILYRLPLFVKPAIHFNVTVATVLKLKLSNQMQQYSVIVAVDNDSETFLFP